MFSLQLLTEALLVGVFLTLALSPLVIRFTPQFADKEGLLPMAKRWASCNSAIFLVLLLAYALGVSGQRVADNLFDDVAFTTIGPAQAYEDGFSNWLNLHGKLPWY
jgi:hypothetical protein